MPKVDQNSSEVLFPAMTVYAFGGRVIMLAVTGLLVTYQQLGNQLRPTSRCW